MSQNVMSHKKGAIKERRIKVEIIIVEGLNQISNERNNR